MKYRDSIVASTALALSTLGMAVVIDTSVYRQAASAEARGLSALSAALAPVAVKGAVR